jgi:hypothetical protein
MKCKLEAGFSLVEVVVVAVILVVLVGVGALLMHRGSSVSDYLITRQAIVDAMHKQGARASAGTAQTLAVREIPGVDPTHLNPDGVVEGPGGAVVTDTILLEAGRGYPWVDGVCRAAAVVIEDAGDPATRSAVVMNRAGLISVWRWDGMKWVTEEVDDAGK